MHSSKALFRWPLLITAILLLTQFSIFAEPAGNGIYVSGPKLFDARALYLMLEDLEDQYERVQVVDSQKLIDALGLLQGQQVRDRGISASLSSLPRPSTMTSSELSDEGDLQVTSATESRSELNPQAPELPELIAVPNGSPSFGLHAQDLLADQVNLTYQIFSLRLLLQRALSDRLLPDGDPRQQAILGFQVSLDPPDDARHRVAVVEVTIVPVCRAGHCCGGGDVEIVSLMPQEKTFNASRVSTKATQFGGSPIVSVFSLGASVRKRNQVFYLYRDTDTLSFPRLPNPAEQSNQAVTFGWQFRPVLGRESVSPGSRQLLAVLALPEADVRDPRVKDEDDKGYLDLEAHVRTYWKKYRDKTQTTRSREELPQGPELIGKVEAWKSRWFEAKLAPEIQDVDWAVVGADSALVTIQGRNFFSGTKAYLGGRIVDENSGLVLKSDQTLELHTPLRSLATEDIVLSGRFGSSVEVAPKVQTTSSGIELSSIEMPSLEGKAAVPITITVQDREGQDLDIPDDWEPLVTVGNEVITGPHRRWLTQCQAINFLDPEPAPQPRTCLGLEVVVNTQLLRREVEVGVRFPFLGRSWAAAQPLQRADLITRVVRLGGKKKTLLAIRGSYMEKGYKVWLDREYSDGHGLEFIDRTTLLLEVEEDILGHYKLLTLVTPYGLQFLDIPPGKAPTPRPKLAEGQVREIRKDSSVGVSFLGENLSAIEKVRFDSAELVFGIKPDGKEITIYVSRKVTEKVGLVDLVLEAKGGQKLAARVSVKP